MSRTIPRRAWERGRPLTGVTGAVIVIVVITIFSIVQPHLLANPLVLAGAKAAITATVGYLTMRWLRIRSRLHWRLGR